MPVTISDLAVGRHLNAVHVTWVNSETTDLQFVEVVAALVNNRDVATRVGVGLISADFRWLAEADPVVQLRGSKLYFWARAVYNNETTGSWFPVSSTAGVELNAPLLDEGAINGLTSVVGADFSFTTSTTNQTVDGTSFSYTVKRGRTLVVMSCDVDASWQQSIPGYELALELWIDGSFVRSTRIAEQLHDVSGAPRRRVSGMGFLAFRVDLSAAAHTFLMKLRSIVPGTSAQGSSSATAIGASVVVSIRNPYIVVHEAVA